MAAIISYRSCCFRSLVPAPPSPCPFKGNLIINPPANTGDIRDSDWIPGAGRSPGGGNGNPLQYSCLENPKDSGTWQATVHGVTESGTTEAT